MTHKSILERDGRAVSYVDEGEGPVALVVVPGSGADDLGVVAHYLAEEAGFRVVQVAASRGTTEDSELSAGVADVVAVIDHLQLADTWVGGHGAGGAVARALAVEQPERINGLLLLAAADDDVALPPEMPVLIIQGELDPLAPPATGEALRATAPDRTSLAVIAGGGHDFPLTRPIETAVVIEEYLDWD